MASSASLTTVLDSRRNRWTNEYESSVTDQVDTMAMKH